MVLVVLGRCRVKLGMGAIGINFLFLIPYLCMFGSGGTVVNSFFCRLRGGLPVVSDFPKVGGVSYACNCYLEIVL